MIGLLVPELGNPIFPALAQAMEQRADARGFATILCNTAGSALREAEYVHMLLERRVDGMIFISSELTDLRSDHRHYVRLRRGGRAARLRERLGRVARRHVRRRRRARGRASSRPSTCSSSGTGASALSAGDRYSLPTRDKAEGRAQALARGGHRPDGLVAHAAVLGRGRPGALRALLAAPGGRADRRRLLERPDGDRRADGGGRAGSRRPGRPSVVGFDGIEAASWTQPGLTTIEQPIADIAETAVEALKSLIDEPERPLPDFVFRPKTPRARLDRPAEGDSMSKIVIDHVTKIYPGDVKAADDVTLEIASGEFMVLVGPSGCGKSTLMRMVAGLEDVTEGTILIDERDVTELSPRHRDIAMVFQNYALYPHMTVRKNLGYGLKVRKTPKPEVDRRVDEVAKLLGLEDLLDRRPAALSGGQRQRVAMGRAIVREPAAFLMDEPLSNLDAKLRVSMRAELSRLHERLGVTTIYVTHDQVEAMTLGQRVAVMRDGRIQQVDAPQELYSEPANLFVAAFIGSPVDEPRRGDGRRRSRGVRGLPHPARARAAAGRATAT